MNRVDVSLGDRSYTISIAEGLLARSGPFLRDLGPWRQAAVISDQTVSRLYGERVMASLAEAGFEAFLQVVPDGESAKSFGEYERLMTAFIAHGLKRDGLVIALGGGVVGDLAGFAASTYLRGVPFVQIPTTLLAQVDSSVGGKTGINHPLGKNLIGSFYQPLAVLIDPQVLATLPERERWSGLAEVVKYGLIRDEAFFAFLEEKFDALFSLEDPEAVIQMIARSCAIKADIVSRDEREGGLRRVLNFGHTLGHALEAVTGYGYFRHGEAVVWGMRWAAWVSNRNGLLKTVELKRIARLLDRFDVPPLPPSLSPDALADRIGLDKKQTQTGLHLVLLEAVGRARVMPVQEVFANLEGWLADVRS